MSPKFMQIDPLLILDEKDFQPFIESLQKATKTTKPLKIRQMCCIATDKGWRVEIQTEDK